MKVELTQDLIPYHAFTLKDFKKAYKKRIKQFDGIFSNEYTSTLYYDLNMILNLYENNWRFK